MFDRPESSKVFYRNQRRIYPVIDYGEGIYLFDLEGKRYLDALGGVGVVTIGHGVGEIVDAMQRQAKRVCFAYGNYFTSEAQLGLAERVIELAPDGITKAFFVSGGAEATESALKFTRQYFVESGKPSKYKIIGRWGSFHGNTIAALSMGGRVSWQEMYGPLLLDFPHIEPCYPYRCRYCSGDCTLQCADDLERAIVEAGPDTVAGFIADPLVGATLAASVPPSGYFPRIREICDEYDVLLIVDEVLTGFGRTGRGFAIEHWGVTPDIIACGKGISSGYAPLGATLVHERIADAIHRGSGVIMHGHTYGNNPFTCSVGLAVQEYVGEHRLIERSAELGEYLHERAQQLLELPSVGDIRGKGLFLGVELVEDKAERRPYSRERRLAETLLEVALEEGVTLFPGTGGPRGDSGDTFIIAPPFIITREQIDETIDLLKASIIEAERRCEEGIVGDSQFATATGGRNK